MATIQSAATGNWATGATWVGGVAPGTGDTGVVNVGHTVTIAATLSAIKVVKVDGGSLIINANIAFDDASGAGFQITATNSGGVSSNGTAAAPRSITSATTTPTNPWTFAQYDVEAEDARVIDFSYVQFTGNYYYIGNDDNYINMFGGYGTLSTSDIIINNVSPPLREPIIVTHPILYRVKSRVYDMGGHASVLTVEGNAPYSSFFFQQLEDMRTARKRLAFYSEYFHLSQCRIERCAARPRPGVPRIPFTITLIEDD